MAGDWLQLDHDLPEKPEVLGICARTGEMPETIIGRLFKLWRLADRQTLDGVIPHATPKSLAAIVGGSHDFWEAVIEVGWLVPTPDGLAVPGFLQRFSQSAKRRMLDAKQKQTRRGADECPQHVRNDADTLRTNVRNLADECPPAERTNCGHVADPESESVPIPESEPEPTPLPEPGPEKTAGSAGAEPRAAMAAPRAASSDRSAEIRDVFAHYRKYHPRAHPKPRSESKEWRAITDRLKGGYSAADLCLAIDGCHKSPFHCGENADGKVYQSLELIMRDDSKVATFMELAEERSGPVHSDKTKRTMRAVASWAQGSGGNG